MGAKIGVKVKRAKEALKGRDLASCSLPLYRITAAGNDPSKHGGGALEEEQNCSVEALVFRGMPFDLLAVDLRGR